MRGRGRSHFLALLLLTAPLARAQTTDVAPPTTAPEIRVESVDALIATLTGDKSTQRDRDESARRLLLWKTPPALDAIREALKNVASVPAQLSAARAIANEADPDLSFVDPLFALLQQNRPLVEAACEALRSYQFAGDVLSRLIKESNNAQQREIVRVATIRAVGTFPEKRAAEALVNLLSHPEESAAVRSAAAEALASLTGRGDLGQDVPGWKAWWQGMQALSDADWRARALGSSAGRLARLQAQYQALSGEATILLQDNYRSAADTQKPDILLRMLRSPQPAIRAIGALTLAQEQSEGRQVTSAAREALRDLIGDSDSHVRYETIRALATSNDSSVIDALLAQLDREEQPGVQAAIASTLEPMRDLRVVDPMLTLLKRGEPFASEAAAGTLEAVADKLRQDNPARATDLALALKRLYEDKDAFSGTASTREAVLQAMVPLRSPELRDLFLRALTPDAPAGIRRAALRGLGALGDRNTADTIVTWLEDSDDAIRLEAVDALGKTGGFEYAEVLYRRINPTIESNPQVRQRAWTVLTSLFPGAPIDQLQFWADRFKNDPTRRLAVLVALRDKLIQNGDDASLAIKRQEIGEEQMNLEQYPEAALSFRPALDYWSSQKEPKQITIEKLTGQLIRALLRSKQYSEAAQFAAHAISRSTTNQEIVGPPIRDEIERLRDAKQSPDALSLITEAKKMAPALDSRYLGTITQIEDQLKKKPS